MSLKFAVQSEKINVNLKHFNWLCWLLNKICPEQYNQQIWKEKSYNFTNIPGDSASWYIDISVIKQSKINIGIYIIMFASNYSIFLMAYTA